jgi:hypothetical protein
MTVYEYGSTTPGNGVQYHELYPREITEEVWAKPYYKPFKDKMDVPDYDTFVDSREMRDLGMIINNLKQIRGGKRTRIVYAAGGDESWMCDVRNIALNARDYKRVRFVSSLFQVGTV